MEGFMDKVQREFEAKVVEASLKQQKVPQEVVDLMVCIIRAGCPADALLNGLLSYAKMKKQEEHGELHELLKDMPFKVELEGEENE